MIEGIIAGLALLLGIIGYFLKIMHSDVRKNTEETGKNKGRIEQLGFQLETEKKLREVHFTNSEKINRKAYEDLSVKIDEVRQDIKLLMKK